MIIDENWIKTVCYLYTVESSGHCYNLVCLFLSPIVYSLVQTYIFQYHLFVTFETVSSDKVTNRSETFEYLYQEEI